MTGSAILALIAAIGLGVVLYEMGARQGAKLGFRLGIELSNEAVNRFIAWLEPEDRMVFKLKLREYNAIQAASADKVAESKNAV